MHNNNFVRLIRLGLSSIQPVLIHILRHLSLAAPTKIRILAMVTQAVQINPPDAPISHSDSAANGNTSDALKLSSQLKGKIFCIPSLRAIFDHWPSAVSLHVDRLRREIDGMLER